MLDAGRLLPHRGKTRRALAVLEEAARRAERQGHATYILNARFEIAVIYARLGEPGLAWENLAAAIEAHQRIRGLTIDPELRTDVGGLWLDVFDWAIHLLVGAAETTVDGRNVRGLPARPAVVALELSERARSRVLLELLGDRFEPGADTGLPLAEEAGIRAELEAAHQRLRDAGPAAREQALAAVRTVAERLDALYDEWQAGGGRAAEYVALRRGQPAGYAEVRRLLTAGP
jgi:hypothetical protein